MVTTATLKRDFLRLTIGLLAILTATPILLQGKIGATSASVAGSKQVLATYTLSLHDFPGLKIVGGSVKLVRPEQMLLNPDQHLYGMNASAEIRKSYPIVITRRALNGATAFQVLSTYGVERPGFRIADLRTFPVVFNETEAQLRISGVMAMTSASGVVDGVPSKLVLEQNFPNPFNPSTLIRYGLPAGSKVKLTVHTLFGNQVRVLVDETQGAGFHHYDFSASDLPPGAYFYRLQTEHGSLTRRMVLSK